MIFKLAAGQRFRQRAFTIVELLVVIVVIGILAGIVSISYAGISNKAIISSLQFDLANVNKQLKLDQVINGSYPINLAAANDGKGLSSNSGITYQYAVDNNVTPQTFCLNAAKNEQSYSTDQDGVFVAGGKNVVKSSGALLAGSGALGITSSITADGYLQVVSIAGNSNWFTYFITDYTGVETSFNEGDDVIVTMDMKSPNHNVKPGFYFKPGMGYYPLQGTMGTEFSTMWLTTKWKKANGLVLHLGWSSVVGTTLIKNIKIAKGTTPTCWTPAP